MDKTFNELCHSNNPGEEMPSKKFISKADLLVCEYLSKMNCDHVLRDFIEEINGDTLNQIFRVLKNIPDKVTCMALKGNKREIQYFFSLLASWKMPLTTLNLSRTACGNEELHLVHSFTNLTKINLSGCQEISDEGMKELVKLPLKHINVAYTKVSDVGLKIIATIVTIEDLNLVKCDITDEGLEEAGKSLINLTELDIGRCEKVKGDSFVHLKNLKRIDITFCDGITKGTRKNLPENCNVICRQAFFGA
jgi:hypothetical protein